jgi:ferritin
MISKAMQAAINEQINNEFYSAYLYLAMSAYFESINMPGSAKWMRTQFEEEQTHGLKLYDYLLDRSGIVALKAIEEPKAKFSEPLAVWEMVLEHEQKVTASINRLYALAVKEGDYATQTALAWFLSEQVEEEKNATLMVERFRMAGSNPASLLLFDGHFTKRGE